MCNIYEGGTVKMKLASGKRNKVYQQEEQTQSALIYFTWFAQVEDSRVVCAKFLTSFPNFMEISS
jgi:hypothetical protein